MKVSVALVCALATAGCASLQPAGIMFGTYPVYPEDAPKGPRGIFAAKCTISAQGLVERCAVLQSVPGLDQAVLESLQARRYRPAMLGGQPVATEQTLQFHVVVPDGPKPMYARAPAPKERGAVMAFDASKQMVRPELVSGRDPIYTRAALEARVQGEFIGSCVIDVDGAVRDCRVIQSLPYMDEAIVDALQSRRYKPVTFEGRPVAVEYSYVIKLALPNRRR